MADIDVTDDPQTGRFEARVDGLLAGFSEYRVRDGRIVFTHTEVDDAFEGEGVGSALVRTALTRVREGEGLQVVPLCPFVKAWIDRHPDFQDLVAPGNPAS